MMVTVTLPARDVTAWRGARGSADMMNGLGALILRAEGTGARVEIEGSPQDLADLRDRLNEALTAATW